MTGDTQKHALNQIAYDWEQKVREALTSYRKAPLPEYYSFSKDDRIRLLNLKVWTLRYSLTLEQILNILLPYWDKKVRKRIKSGFGIRVATLTGTASQNILESQVLREAPNNELERSHAAEATIRYAMARKPDFKTANDPFDFASNYRKEIEQYRKIVSERQSTVRNYRTA